MQKVKSLFLFTACLLAIALALPFTAALAQTDVYQLEAGAFYLQEKDENDEKMMSYGVQASYYFSQVSLTTLPYAEAAFLARASNIQLYGMKVTREEDKADGDGYRYGVAGEFFIPNLPLYVSAEAARMKLDMDNNGIDVEMTNTELTGKAGFLPMNGLLFGVLIGREIEKIDIPDFPAFNEENTTTSYGGFLKAVMPVGTGMAIGLDLTVTRMDTEPKEGDETSDTNIEGMLSFYPMAQLGLGLIYETQSGDDVEDEGNTYGIAVIFFPVPNVGINASFSRFMPKNDKDADGEKIVENDIIKAGAVIRF